MTTVAIEFGALLRAAREAKGLKVTKAAEIIGVTHGHLSRIESGMSTPSLQVLIRACECLQIHIGELEPVKTYPQLPEGASCRK